jgi:hypothetical protein
MPVPGYGRGGWRRVAHDLIALCSPLCSVRGA